MAMPASCVISFRLCVTTPELVMFEHRLADEGLSHTAATRSAVASFPKQLRFRWGFSERVRLQVSGELKWLHEQWLTATARESGEIRIAFRAIEMELVSALELLPQSIDDPQRAAGRLVRRRGGPRERPAPPELSCRISRAEASAWRATAAARGLSLSRFLRIALDERFKFRRTVAHGGSLPNPIAHPAVTALHRAALLAARNSVADRREDWQHCCDRLLGILHTLLNPGAASWTI